MQENLEVVNEFCRATGMKLIVKNSAGYDIKPSANRSYVINDFHPKWEVDGQKLPLNSTSRQYEVPWRQGQ